MAKRLLTLFLIGTLLFILVGSCIHENVEKATGIAVEFNNHAACAYIAYEKGWFDEEGLDLVPVFQVYESGATIAAALARGDIQIGYMGLTAAIMTYARGVPIKVVAGVHKYGYGLVARPELKGVKDLQNKTIGCLREGTVTDLLLNLMIDKYHLQNVTIMRMSPTEEVIALITGRLDAAFLPEQHATMAESRGFPMLISSQDLWPGMQGDVLVVRTDLLEDNPDQVKRLVEVTQKATIWVNEHRDETAEIMARQLQAAGERNFLAKEAELNMSLEIKPEVISRSMDRIDYATSIDPAVVQKTIDYMVELGYIKEGVKATDILDLTYLQKEEQDGGK
jgi:NitT/TauT family transport system substrate-binding protein